MQTLTIGRNSSNNIVLNDSMVSRIHAQLTLMDNGQIIIKDLGSSNGTFVNGNKITECYLKTGDIVKCGGTFFDWKKYSGGYVSFPTHTPEQNYSPETYNQQFNQVDLGNETRKEFSLGETLKYLTTRCLNTDDLFKTEWDSVPSILFFILLPLGLSLIVSLIIYSKLPFSILYEVVLPFVFIFLSFGVSQFLTISLLSINRSTNFLKNLFASSIFSFLQFLYTALWTIISFVFFRGFLNIFSSSPFSSFHQNFMELSAPWHIVLLLFLSFIIITIFISILIILFVFIYNYFRSIGVSKSVSIHFVVFSFTLNFLINVCLLYLLISISGHNLIHL